MIEKIRLIIATLVTPILFAGVMSSASLFDEKYLRLYSFVVMYLVIFIMSLPVYVHLHKVNGLKLVPIMFGTFMVGIFGGIVQFLFGGGPYTLSGIGHEILGILYLGIFGAFVGLVWWVIARAGTKKYQLEDTAES